MRRFLLSLRVFALLFQIAPAFPANALMPSVALLVIFIGLMAYGTSADIAVTLAVATLIVLRAKPRIGPTVEHIRRSNGTALAVFVVGIVFVLPIAILLWQMDTRWSQHMVTFASLCVALTRLIDIADGRYTAARMTWPEFEPAWPMLTRVMFLKSLAFALLNETILNVASLEIWIAWVALIPIFQHYTTAALTATVFLELDRES